MLPRTELIRSDGFARDTLPANLAGIRGEENCSPPARRKFFEFAARVSATASAAICILPEFTMLEWYRANSGYGRPSWADTVVVIAHAAAGDRHRPVLVSRQKPPIPSLKPELLTVAAGVSSNLPGSTCWPRLPMAKATRVAPSGSRRRAGANCR